MRVTSSFSFSSFFRDITNRRLLVKTTLKAMPAHPQTPNHAQTELVMKPWNETLSTATGSKARQLEKERKKMSDLVNRFKLRVPTLKPKQEQQQTNQVAAVLFERHGADLDSPVDARGLALLALANDPPVYRTDRKAGNVSHVLTVATLVTEALKTLLPGLQAPDRGPGSLVELNDKDDQSRLDMVLHGLGLGAMGIEVMRHEVARKHLGWMSYGARLVQAHEGTIGDLSIYSVQHPEVKAVRSILVKMAYAALDKRPADRPIPLILCTDGEIFVSVHFQAIVREDGEIEYTAFVSDVEPVDGCAPTLINRMMLALVLDEFPALNISQADRCVLGYSDDYQDQVVAEVTARPKLAEGILPGTGLLRL